MNPILMDSILLLFLAFCSVCLSDTDWVCLTVLSTTYQKAALITQVCLMLQYVKMDWLRLSFRVKKRRKIPLGLANERKNCNPPRERDEEVAQGRQRCSGIWPMSAAVLLGANPCTAVLLPHEYFAMPAIVCMAVCFLVVIYSLAVAWIFLVQRVLCVAAQSHQTLMSWRMRVSIRSWTQNPLLALGGAIFVGAMIGYGTVSAVQRVVQCSTVHLYDDFPGAKCWAWMLRQWAVQAMGKTEDAEDTKAVHVPPDRLNCEADQTASDPLRPS